jgi:hypothetical protein
MDLLRGLVVNDAGDRWGDTATAWQEADAVAIVDPEPDGPRRFMMARPKDGRKTSDLAAINIAIGCDQMPPDGISYAIASDKEQVDLLLDSMRGFQQRTPGLRGAFTVLESGVVRFSNGAQLRAMPADAASIQGLRYYLMTADELHEWKDTRTTRKVLGNAIAGVEKTLPNGARPRFAVITNAGSPMSLAGRTHTMALKSPHWRVSDVPGPLPWLSEAQLAALEGDCATRAEFERLHLNRWSQADDSLATLEDMQAACWLPGPVEPLPAYRYRYLIGVDLSLKRDLTAAAVMHAEPGEVIEVQGRPVQTGRRVIVDRLEVWRAERGKQIDLADVELWLDHHARTYGAHVVLDEYQAGAIHQSLLRRGIQSHTVPPNQGSNHRQVVQLMSLLKDRAIDLPADDELLQELATTEVLEVQPNVFRLGDQRVAGLGHHDRISAIALGAYELLIGQASHFTPAPAPLRNPHRWDDWPNNIREHGGGLREIDVEAIRDMADEGDPKALEMLAAWGDTNAQNTIAARGRRRRLEIGERHAHHR